YKAFPIENRHVIRSLIGDEAEFLAYVFCVTERPKEFLVNAALPEILIRDHYANNLIHLPHVELRKLLEIEAANLLEQGGDIEGLLRRLLATEISVAARARISTYLRNPPSAPRPVSAISASSSLAAHRFEHGKMAAHSFSRTSPTGK